MVLGFGIWGLDDGVLGFGLDVRIRVNVSIRVRIRLLEFGF